MLTHIAIQSKEFPVPSRSDMAITKVNIVHLGGGGGGGGGKGGGGGGGGGGRGVDRGRSADDKEK